MAEPPTKPKATKHPLRNTRALQNALVKWFEKEGKSYPWRDTTDPWAILVSEIMLQQTQVATVLGKGHYTRFMALYPTPRDMAEATEQEVLTAWEGLGYYRRARNLHAAARTITRAHSGIFPRKFEKIRALPGIGSYTAGAVASFAYNEAQPIVDANVARVFSRLFDFQQRIDTSSGNNQLWQWAEDLLFRKNPRHYNSALMELGQSYCSNKSPNCSHCPVKHFCQCMNPTTLPIKRSSAKITRGHGRRGYGEPARGHWSARILEEGVQLYLRRPCHGHGPTVAAWNGAGQGAGEARKGEEGQVRGGVRRPPTLLHSPRLLCRRAPWKGDERSREAAGFAPLQEMELAVLGGVRFPARTPLPGARPRDRSMPSG